MQSKGGKKTASWNMALIFYTHLGELQAQMSEYAIKGKVKKWFLTLKTVYRLVGPKIQKMDYYKNKFKKISEILEKHDREKTYELLEEIHAELNGDMDRANMLVPSTKSPPPGRALTEFD